MSKKHSREHDSVTVTESVHKSDVALREEAIQQFWEAQDIFHKSLERPGGKEPIGEYLFYDGPPFATGLPHYGHLLAGTIKDAVPRFWTMRGYRVRRKWGWDCHGLPLENLIEKELGLASKRDIEEFGIQNFNEKARSAVMRYADEWREIIPRFGRFVDMDDDYKTMDSSYTESVWWVFKTLHEKGLVYEGFKGMHLCPRCGTTLSNFEVNLGYKDIKDIAVTVKLPLLDEAGEATNTSLLVWTTTPWTLPGNLAAAVHRDYTYLKVRLTEAESETYVILAKERVAQLGDMPYEVIAELPGSDLVGKKYEPPFPYLRGEVPAADSDRAWTIYHADYVELGEEGTGAVHLAPAYGEEDMELAKECGIPIVHHVDYEGRFMNFVTDFAGQKVKPKDDDNAGVTHLDADIEIVKALKISDRLVKKENITHSYPHCWRDDTPLLNYATTSWFVNVPKIRTELVAANQTVHWVPEHVGANRFGKWLEGARDWAVSRQRYWGAPLPIWKNPITDAYKVFGSLAELQAYVPKSGNTYIVMRHAEAESNLSGVINADPTVSNPLTSSGQEQARQVAQTLHGKGITRIIHSQLQRAQETAALLADELGLPTQMVTEDRRLNELQAGPELEGAPWSRYSEKFGDRLDQYEKEATGIENRKQLQQRLGQFLFEAEVTYQNETILIVSHAGPIFALESAARGDAPEQAAANMKTQYLKNAETREVAFALYPHNDYYQLDFHRPYIDHIELYEDGVQLERVPDVFDCWFESGAMPYAQTHYPFANLDVADPAKGVRFPANFIAESIDQTRGWFYSLMVLGVALFGKSPYQNVITNGLVLAEDGKKMSKSLQNFPDPVDLVDRVGADAVRYYLLSSSIIRGEDLNFSEKEVTEQMRKNIGRLHNVLALYELCADGSSEQMNSPNVLDRWIVTRLDQLIQDVTAGYERYELDRATRPIADFIDDLSVWYVRRSRDRLKGEDVADRMNASGTLRYILSGLAKVMAPVMPFYAEHLYRAVREDTAIQSVHLCAWPTSQPVDEQLLGDMHRVREIVSYALEARTVAGLRVRQPLAELHVAQSDPLAPELTALIADEVNVKAVKYDPTLTEYPVVLDTTITTELAAEGTARELVRAIQDLRKKANLVPSDRIDLLADRTTTALLQEHADMVLPVVGAATVRETDMSTVRAPATVTMYETTYTVAIDPIQ